MHALKIDHFAVSCETLSQGVEYVADCLGVVPTVQGAHPKMGTHNRLLSLGPSIYLEVIAIDPSAASPDQSRWFDLDRFSGPPRLTNWICSTSDLPSALDLAPENAGHPMLFERDIYQWQIAVPDDGCLPFDGGFPALIQWSGTAHPAPHLPDVGCRLHSVSIGHPKRDALQESLAAFRLPSNVLFETTKAVDLKLTIQTPTGERQLS